MKKHLIYLLISVFLPVSTLYATMPTDSWRMHEAYTQSTSIAIAHDKVYAISDGSLFSVDKETTEIQTYNKLTGLNDANINYITYDNSRGQLVIFYANGNIDFLSDNGNVINLNDLKEANVSGSKQVNSTIIKNDKLYAATGFGVLVVNLKKHEIADTYYIGQNSTAVQVTDLTIKGDSIMALVEDGIYVANLNDNIVDYAYWKKNTHLPSETAPKQLSVWQDETILLTDSTIFRLHNGSWLNVAPKYKVKYIKTNATNLLALTTEGTLVINNNNQKLLPVYTNARKIDSEGNTLWYAVYGSLGRYLTDSEQQSRYSPNGPILNLGYQMRILHNRLLMVQGGYWGVVYKRPAGLSLYENNRWNSWDTNRFRQKSYDGGYCYDLVDVAIDPNDKKHFFVASYGYGLFEFREDTLYHNYVAENCAGLDKIISTQSRGYTWIDGLQIDADGNLWLLDNHADIIRILEPNGRWHTLKESTLSGLSNAGGRFHNLIIAKNNPTHKLFVNLRSGAGLAILDDNGTPFNNADDKVKYYNTFIDQDNNHLSPEYVYSLVEDKNGMLWAGTTSGILTFKSSTDLLQSNACQRIKVPRNDGTNLADYLLNGEVAATIAVDGDNRKWIGTEQSGLFLVSADGLETIHHFTTDNSPLPDNRIECVAINNRTGEVFIGTSGGLVSYQSDATEPADDYKEVVAYPNPVVQNFDGVITITGLMDESDVRIADSAGRLIYATRSQGGTATWNLKDSSSHRVPTGVYLVLVSSTTSSQHIATKILVIN